MVSLIGSVARAPWKEVPRFGPYVARVQGRGSRPVARTPGLARWAAPGQGPCAALWDEGSIGIASHQVDVFILEPVTDRYLGRLCDFKACPKGKAECRVPGCGDMALLRQPEGFR